MKPKLVLITESLDYHEREETSRSQAMHEYVTPAFLQRSNHTFDVVDHKVAEAEFFLRKLYGTSIGFEFNCFLSAYLSSARTITLALQRFSDIPGFSNWYKPHQEALKANPVAKMFLELRNDHLHGGMYPVSGSSGQSDRSTFFLRGADRNHDVDDLAVAAREHFISLLSVVHDCYVALGVHIDPQQYFTAENFAKLGRGIADAEVEAWGWVCLSPDGEEWNDDEEDDRWYELRSHVDECQINYLFCSYLGKTTPQPKLPDYLEEIQPSAEDRGWNHIPAGPSL